MLEFSSPCRQNKDAPSLEAEDIVLAEAALAFRSLKAWVQGANFDDLSETFQRQVSAWRFTPIVETTIEEKHARVALSKRSRRLGPVRISLANRLPLMERWIRKETVSATDLLDRFNRSRSLKTVPALLGLQDHPALEGSALGSWLS